MSRFGKLYGLIVKIGTDKVAHFCLSGLIFLSVGGVLSLLFTNVLGFVLSGFITVALGFGKECLDYRSYGKFDRKDFVADLLGLAYGILVVVLFHFLGTLL